MLLFRHVTLADTVQEGDPIACDSEGRWRRPLATVGSAVHAPYITLEAGEAGDVIRIAREPSWPQRRSTFW